MHQINEEIKIIKLVNGDDILCRICTGTNQLPENGPLLRIEKPLIIKYVPQITQEGFKDYIALTKWTAYTPDKIVTITKDKIMTITNASDEMMRSYVHLSEAYDRTPDAPLPKSFDEKEKLTEEENDELNEIFEEHNDKRTLH